MQFIEIKSPLPWESKAYKSGRFTVLVSKDNNEWHMSISHEYRYPTWDEIKEARYQLLPDNIYMAMILPPKKEFVNVHPNCFHLHELKESEIPKGLLIL